jgi:hypothetical protein
MVLGICGCSKQYLEIDTQLLQEKIYEPTAIRYETLSPTTVLYLDHSTCVIDASENSKVFKALRPQLGQYSDTLVLIKGVEFETIPLNRSANKVFAALQTINTDIPYADILRAVEEIVAGNQEAILITDCEYFEAKTVQNGVCHDEDPYLSAPLIEWLKKGRIIYIVVEPYQEKYKGKSFDKRRFYFIFTDDKMEAPISHNMLNELKSSLTEGLCTLYKMTNSDIQIVKEGDIVEQDLTFGIEETYDYEFITIDDDWNAIREYIMKLDKYSNPIPGEQPLPLIKNIVFGESENYKITDIRIKASNITAQYVALEDSAINSAVIDIPDGFMLDPETLSENRLNVMLTDKIFNYLTDEFGGNLIRLDFIVNSVEIKPYDYDLFVWQSLFVDSPAICIAKSIDNALHDVSVVPTKRVIHTVFLKTESYKR